MRTDAAARADQQQQPQRVTRSRGPDKAAASEASRLIVKKDAHAKDGASSDKSAVRSPQNFGSNDDEVPVAPEAARRSVEEDTRPNTPPLKAAISPRQAASSGPARMEATQSSPTQLNDDRESYERYCTENGVVVSSDLGDIPADHTQSTSRDHTTLKEGDTGFFHLDSNVVALHSDSPLQGDHASGDEAALPLFAVETQDEDDGHRAGYLPPETPAPPKNPFAAKAGPALLDGSQLFKQTPFSTVARGVSPTSSRPSPHDFPAPIITSPQLGTSSPLKNRRHLSSPLPPIGDVSSPQALPEVPSEVPGVDSTPLAAASARGHGLPSESSRAGHRRKRSTLPPLAEYEPMKVSQERREMSEARSPSDGSADESEDDEERRRRARRKQEEATRQLSSIRISRPVMSEDIEVPSTSKKQPKSRSQSEEHQRRDPDYSDLPETVADSQEATARQQGEDGPEGADDGGDGDDDCVGIRQSDLPADDGVADFPTRSSGNAKAPTRRSTRQTRQNIITSSHQDVFPGDAIPETSPTEGVRLKAFREIYEEHPSVSSKAVSFPDIFSLPTQESSLPSKNNTQGSSLPRARATAGTNMDNAVENAVPMPGDSEVKENPSLPRLRRRLRGVSDPDAPVSPSPPAHSTRGQKRKKSGVAGGKPSSVAPTSSAPERSTSVLSSLHTTPVLSSETTPATEESDRGGSSQRSTIMAVNDDSSPVVSKARRRDALETLPKLKTSTPAVAAARASSRVTRHQTHQQQPSSTDELVRSPSATPPTFEHSMKVSRPTASRPGRTSIRGGQPAAASREQSLRGGKVFEGMAFAISFQSKKPGEGSDEFQDRMEYAKAIERKIQQAGGRILASGFDELFDKPSIKSAASSPLAASPSDSEINILPTAAATGFTALIADGHSRKVKYMQALALGLPCIATRWVTTCIEKDKLVDWNPYLLCAGQSTFLGDAIRSRNLAPYDAGTAKLAAVLEDRLQLLEGSRILLVMKRADEGKKMAYVFLTRVLGASLSRVYSIDEARSKLQAMEDLGRPYDWVYVDDAVDKKELFASTGAAEGGAKKRKRGSGGTQSGPSPKKIRTLSDELVIQSLILGRLIEEGEMEE